MFQRKLQKTVYVFLGYSAPTCLKFNSSTDWRRVFRRITAHNQCHDCECKVYMSSGYFCGNRNVLVVITYTPIAVLILNNAVSEKKKKQFHIYVKTQLLFRHKIIGISTFSFGCLRINEIKPHNILKTIAVAAIWSNDRRDKKPCGILWDGGRVAQSIHHF